MSAFITPVVRKCRTGVTCAISITLACIPSCRLCNDCCYRSDLFQRIIMVKMKEKWTRRRALCRMHFDPNMNQ
jgi:hypothetical protein